MNASLKAGSVIALSTILSLALLPGGCMTAPKDRTIRYPEAPREPVVENLHGVSVPDPYRWLEELDAPRTREWIEAQNKITFDYLESIPEREAIKQRLTELWNFEDYNVPAKKGGRYFFTKNDGLQNQDVLYTTISLDAQPRVLLDPNKLSEDGTIALTGTDVSENGRYLAYGLATAGSDWQEWRVRDIETGADLPDHVKWVKFSGASWTNDGKGFFYSRYDEPDDESKLKQLNYFQKLYYHRLGTPQSQDELIYHRPDQKEWGFGGSVTDDGAYLIIHVWKGTERKNLIFYKELRRPDAPVVELITEFEAQFNFIDNDGPVFWFFTDLNAPRGRIVAIDTRTPYRDAWRELIPEGQDTLRSVNVVHNKFLATYLKDAYTKIRLFSLAGAYLRDLELPGIGSAFGFGGKRTDDETFYEFTSFTTPGTVFRYDLITGKSTVFKKPTVDFNPDDFETRQVFYHSKDGIRVPMFITHKKGIKLNGKNPTLLYGYGGFNIPITPGFSVSRTVWMELGGVYAVANIRGGGEYGKQWHDAGRLHNKQNVFDDFLAAAEWLIENRYTSPDKLAISGGSNGGLLVGACTTQRPDLFAAAVPAVGVMDMLRFHKFTIGWAWTSDYGSPDDPDYFKTLYAYSPLHNLRPGTKYPATLVTTADHDDRVFPAHSFKFAAALQHAHAGKEPVMIRIQTKAGHGAGKPTSMIIQEQADVQAFLVKTLNMNLDDWLRARKKKTQGAA